MGYVFFFNDTATTEIYSLSLHDALPISRRRRAVHRQRVAVRQGNRSPGRRELRGVHELRPGPDLERSEEHTSELQSQSNIVCRLLTEKKTGMLYSVQGNNQMTVYACQGN